VSRRVLLLLLVLACVAFAGSAVAADAPAPGADTADIPAALTLDDAVRMFHARGFDLLLADAAVARSEGDVLAAGAVNNPTANVAAGPSFNYTPRPGCVGCQGLSLGWGLTDNGALMDVLVGKRGLRKSTAEAALAAAHMDRKDAERVLDAQVKQSYVQVAVAKAAIDFSKEVQAALTQTLELNRKRYPGVITEGELARTEVQKLSADQDVDRALLGARQAQLALALLLGARGTVPDFEVDRVWLKLQVPAALATATEATLFAQALATRPDARAITFRREAADEALRLARRQRVPDIALSLQYSQLGTGRDAAQPPTLMFGLSMNLPVFYQQQGEIQRATADVTSQIVQGQRVIAQIANDVTTAFTAFVATRTLLARLEGSVLARAKLARDVVDTQYKAGSATLMDFLDAQRTYIATNQDYLQALSDYWSAVFQLEQAVGTELK